MVALDRTATLDLDRNPNSFARFWRSSFHDYSAMNENVVLCLCVEHAEVTCFGAIMPRNVQQPMIADLSSHFGVTGSLIENDI